MSTTDAKGNERSAEMTRRVAEEAGHVGDLTNVDESCAEEFVSHTTAVPDDVRGRGAYKDLITGYRTAMPDLSVRVEDSLSDGDDVAIRFTIRGTHEGELVGIKPTGRTVEGSGPVIAWFEGDKAVEVWEYPIQLGMLRQLDVTELPTT